MQATARRRSVVSATSTPRRRLIRSVRPTTMQTKPQTFDRRAFVLFCRNQQRFDTGARSLLFLFPYIAGMLLFAIPIRLLESHPAWAFLWFPAFFGYLILFPFLWMKFLVPKDQRHFLKCPVCLRPTAPPNRLVIIATSRCGHCGETILENLDET